MPKRPDRGDGTRVNQDIRAREVRVIGSDGELLGVMPPIKAVQLAQEEGLDLVEISPNAEPPVCKILDYGKYRYEQQKKANEARKKQKVIDIKEILLRPNIDDHDFETKMKAARRFLDDGDKIKFVLRFRGRELSRMALGLQVLDKVKVNLDGLIKIEQEPKSEGRQTMMVVAPVKS